MDYLAEPDHVVTTHYGTISLLPDGAELDLYAPFKHLSGFYPWKILPVLYAMARAAEEIDVPYNGGPEAVDLMMHCAGYDAATLKEPGDIAEKITHAYPLLLAVTPADVSRELEDVHDMSPKEVGTYCATVGLQTGLSFLHERLERSRRPVA